MIGLAYITDVLGLGAKTAKLLVNRDGQTYSAVSQKQAAVPLKTDCGRFWARVNEIIPNLHTQEDLELLAREGDVHQVFRFLSQIARGLENISPVLQLLDSNAHFYK